jgi:hypothetical protein
MTISEDAELFSVATHAANEPHASSLTNRLNWLRAGVLGANDGIVSTAGIVVGVAAATTATPVIFTVGLAGLVAGAVSMALGEYVSVSAQRDTQRALTQKEREELADLFNPGRPVSRPPWRSRWARSSHSSRSCCPRPKCVFP